MHRHPAIALAEIDQIRTDAADRADSDHSRMALEYPDDPGDPAFGQHFVQDVGLTYPGLRPGGRRVVDHDCERTRQNALLHRKPG
ncbi:hypothetical protein D3C81_1711290 [compost metagenome]